MSLASFLNPPAVLTRVCVFWLWSVSYLCWLHVALAAVRWARPDLLPLLSTAPQALFNPGLVAYSGLEAVFHLYYLSLARAIQKRGKPPMYGRRFLRSVFARSLESGMELEHLGLEGRATAIARREAGLSDADVAVKGGHELRRRARAPTISGMTPLDSAQEAPINPLATKRLRSASFLPRFVAQEPLHRDDPRAQVFRDSQARWFLGSHWSDITARDAEHWLAWALYGADLEEIEAEREEGQRRLKEREERLREASEKATNGHAVNGHVHLNGNGSLAPSGLASPLGITPPPSPIPPPIMDPRDAPSPQLNGEEWSSGAGASRITLTRSDTNETNFSVTEDVRGVRSQPGEWDDPVRGDRLEFLHYCRELIEARQGFTFPQHREGEEHLPSHLRTKLACMRLTLDPIKVNTRPLSLYLITNAVTRLAISNAYKHGFKYQRQGRLGFLIKRPKGWTRELAEKDSRYRPIIFLHGLGIGLGQYAAFVRTLGKDELAKTHPIIIPLWPHISQNIFDRSNFLRPLGHHETTGLLRRVINEEGWHRCGVTVISHSNGTAIHSWLLKSLGSFIRRSCFIDPVVFQLWIPDVIGNFLYKDPENPIQILMRYFVGTEVGTANYLHRHFDWSSCLLWPQDEIPNLLDPHSTRIYLAEHDSILDARDNERYLRSFGMRGPDETTAEGAKGNLHFVEGKAHGEVLMADGEHIREIMAWLQQPDP